MALDKNTIQSIPIQMFPDGRLNVKNAARYLGLKEKTLAMMRSIGNGPKFIKRGHVFYFKEDLDNWLNAPGKAVSTAQANPRKKTPTNKKTTGEGSSHE